MIVIGLKGNHHHHHHQSMRVLFGTCQILRHNLSRHTRLGIITNNNAKQSISLLSGSKKNLSTVSKVGFVGLGNMGLPMCFNLISPPLDRPLETNATTNHDFLTKDLKVLAFDTNHDAMTKAEAGGAKSVSTLEEMMLEEPSVILTVLPNDSSSLSVFDELLSHQKKDTIYVDCSTVSVGASRRNHEQVKSVGSIMVDSPISGGVKGAKDGTLTFMAGMSSMKSVESTKETVWPYLYRMGTRVFECGGPGSGAVTKLCNNMALASQMAGICEAMYLGTTLGMDAQTLSNVIQASTGSCWSNGVNNPHHDVGPIAKNDYNGGFATKLMLKDLTLAMQAIHEANVNAPTTLHVRQLYEELASSKTSESGAKDFGILMKFLQEK